MPLVITITDIDIGREYRVFAVTNEDQTISVFATLSAQMITNAGIAFRKDKTVELTGTARTRAIALFQDIKTIAKAEEGIT